jgi:4-amino-4-deoxy-L-arabinose transferase-like glycosyltransferase
MPRFRWPDLVLLLLVLAIAAGTRAGYLVTCADSGYKAGPLRVQDKPTPAGYAGPTDMRGHPRPTEQDVLVYNLVKSKNFASLAPFALDEEVTAHTSPGYPYMLATVASVGGEEGLDFKIRWLQCVLGSLTAGLYFLFARRAFRSRFVAGLVGLLAAVYPYWIVNTAEINDGVLTTFALACALFCGTWASQTGSLFGGLFMGVSLAGLSLLRAALLPFSFVTIIWFLWRTSSVRGGWASALLAFVLFVGGLAPWTLRNYQIWGEPMPIVDSAYLHLWVGNNPEADGGPPSKTLFASAPDEIRVIETQPDRYTRLGGLVWNELRDQPIESVRRRIQSTISFFLGYRWVEKGQVVEETKSVGDNAEDMPGWLARSYPGSLQGSLAALLFLAFLGWRWSYIWRFESMPAALAMIWIPLPYILGHAENLSGPRLPLDGVMLCFAAFALAYPIPGLGSRPKNTAKIGPAEGPNSSKAV